MSMGTTDINLVKGITRCDAATFFKWQEQITALLAGLSLGQYLTYQLDFTSKTETVIKEGNRCHYLVWATLARSTQQATPLPAKPNLEGFSCANLLWTHINQKFGLAGNNALSVRYQQQLFTMQAPTGSDPTPVLTALLNLQGKINGDGRTTGDSAQVILDACGSHAGGSVGCRLECGENCHEGQGLHLALGHHCKVPSRLARKGLAQVGWQHQFWLRSRSRS